MANLLTHREALTRIGVIVEKTLFVSSGHSYVAALDEIDQILLHTNITDPPAAKCATLANNKQVPSTTEDTSVEIPPLR